ncbi:polysaccharide pyruvyl transferase family protein [Propionibacteriaceae bacterium G57]|uniref:polysaccharide pyruvyl transferase family protein n=1 Tax=Aestuariimicrobium sp. G57 TaxID=3418485 RepID=UPI003DA6F172
MTKRVQAVGYYGWGNFGDELFRRTVQLRSDLLWGRQATVRSFVAPGQALRTSAGALGSLVRTGEMVAGGLWSDTIALCGGSVLEDVRGTQKWRDRLFGQSRSIEALGVSLGPWRTDEARARSIEYVRKMDRVVVRDRASADRIGAGVILGTDLAALHPMPSRPAEHRRYLTICLSNDSGATSAQLVAMLRPMLSAVAVPVKILALNVHPRRGDLALSHAVRDGLSGLGLDMTVEAFESVDQTIDIIAGSAAVWSQRLHGIIVAYLCHVPFLAFGHHAKISDFAQDVGLDEVRLIRELVPGDAVVAAGRSTLSGSAGWALSPQDYIEFGQQAYTSATA